MPTASERIRALREAAEKNERTPSVVALQFDASVTYDVNVETGEVTLREIGPFGDLEYVTLFAEGEFCGEHDMRIDAVEDIEPDADVIERAETVFNGSHFSSDYLRQTQRPC